MIQSEEKKVAKDVAQVQADMKAFLKTQSKKELIRLVMEQANLVIEHVQLNKFLYEENKQLKEQLAAKESK